MATAPIHSCSGLLGLRFSHVLLAFLCTFVGSGSAVTVIQTPSFVSDSTGGKISFSCSVDDTSYRFYLYHQLPGKTELKVIGYLSTGSKTLEEIPPELTNRLEGKGSKHENPSRRELRLELSKLQANDTGFYLCAALYTVKEKETVADAKLSIRNKSALYTFLFISTFYLTSMDCKITRTDLHDEGQAVIGQHLRSHSGQPDLFRLLSKKTWIQFFSYNWNLKAWCP
ncbi:uncharacterized protein LOC132710589 [Pantherophis guttatus]|uniref:Uncharacterized protein LOC132710589 n=1 Tax=Pantherophis guttatus TaxID=94885 RepID=A0ABM3Z4A8_PANGU|nr:uncharacterized protein LOC132710589 [Pantherophis guttatus]